jgi:microsomal dipeptidase-like Zn-dependent dipeptidase
MRFFDAHCDTIQKVVENGADFTALGGMHVTLPGLLDAGMGAQVFAAWAETWTASTAPPGDGRGVGDYPKIVALLGGAGLSSTQVEKICHRNFVRVFRAVMG